jgi:hypothetical protein
MNITNFERCFVAVVAIKILTENSFGPDQIGSKLLHFPGVWLALLPKMTIRETFTYLKVPVFVSSH